MKDIIFKRLLLIALLSGSFAASATQRLLVPIYNRDATPGAYGSLWVSDLAILNTGSEWAEIDNYLACIRVTGCLGYGLKPGRQVSDGYIQASNGPAAVLVIDDRYAGQFAMQLRVRDTSRTAEGYGTWLPIVDEASFQSSVLHLLDIPLAERYRHMLRVYSMDAPFGSRVRVRMYGTEKYPTRDTDPLLAEVFLPISGGFPQYAQLAELATLVGGQSAEGFRVTVEPQGDFHIWAMVSVTNNDTQQVTAIFPASN